MPWVALASAVLGSVSEKQKQDEQRRQAAINMRYSPWSGVGKDNIGIQSNGALQGAIQGAASGMAYNQGAKNTDAWSQWMEKYGAPDKQQNTMPTMGGNNIGPYANGNDYAAAISKQQPPSSKGASPWDGKNSPFDTGLYNPDTPVQNAAFYSMRHDDWLDGKGKGFSGWGG